MSSAICFSLEQSKTPLSGNGLNRMKTKKKKHDNQAFSPFPSMLPKSLLPQDF